jgi:hypothetical protein
MIVSDQVIRAVNLGIKPGFNILGFTRLLRTIGNYPRHRMFPDTVLRIYPDGLT